MSDISWSLLPVPSVFAADKAEALEAGKELFPGHRVRRCITELQNLVQSAAVFMRAEAAPVGHRMHPCNGHHHLQMLRPLGLSTSQRIKLRHPSQVIIQQMALSVGFSSQLSDDYISH